MSRKFLTFAEKRSYYLDKLDDAYATLRKVVADPEWSNDMYPAFKDSCGAIADIISAVRRLNNSESEK